MNIRRAQESDAPFLAKVHIDAWHAAYRGLVPDSFLQCFTYQSRAERFRQSLATGSEETYLVEENGKVMGFLTLGACRDSDLNVDCTGEIWGYRNGKTSLLLDSDLRISSFGEDREGELYVIGYQGLIKKIIPKSGKLPE